MSNSNPKLLPLSHIRLCDANRVGNKAAVLGELLNHNINVPDGVCLTTLAFEQMLDSLQPAFTSEQLKLVETFDQSNLEKLILQHGFNQAISKEIDFYLNNTQQAIAPMSLFCVRSSASIEDRPDYSFAGHFHTSIGLDSLDEIIYAIKKCWASLFNERVIAYVKNSELTLQNAAMAVLIQKLIPAEKSGIMFTCDPVTAENVLLIEASWGLGLPIVSGQITPDLIRLSSSGSILNQTLGSKKCALIVSSRSLQEIVVQPAKANILCLNDRELSLLWENAKKIEKILGLAQDIEFSFSGKDLWILQSRPITGLKNFRQSDISEDF